MKASTLVWLSVEFAKLGKHANVLAPAIAGRRLDIYTTPALERALQWVLAAEREVGNHDAELKTGLAELVGTLEHEILHRD